MRKIINSAGQLLTGEQAGGRGREQEWEAAKFFNVIILIVIIIAHLLLSLSLLHSSFLCSSATPFFFPSLAVKLLTQLLMPTTSTSSLIQQFSPPSFQEITLVTSNEFFLGVRVLIHLAFWKTIRASAHTSWVHPMMECLIRFCNASSFL